MQAMVSLQPASDADNDELDQLTAELRRRLLDDLEVIATSPASSGHAPANAKATDALTLGTLVLTLSPITLHSLVRLIQVWLEHRPVRTARIEIENESIEVSYLTNEDQRRLIESFIERHAAE